MLNFLRNLLGINAPPPSATPFERLNEVAPLKTTILQQHETPHKSSFMRRNPVLDQSEKIAGYEFSLHEKMLSRLRGERESMHKIYDDALLRNLVALEVHALLGERLAFVRLSQVSLDNPLLEKIATVNTVLMLAPSPQALDIEQAHAQLQVLRQRGFAYGVVLRQARLAATPRLIELCREADFVQLETSGFNGMDIKLLLRQIQELRAGDRPKARLIAGELMTFDEFNLCFQGGFDLFLGAFVMSRENWHPPKSEVNRLHVMQLLNLVRSDAEFGEISQHLKQEPVVSFKMLRYINSPVMGLQSPIATLDKALFVLGREKFYRWLSLLLFDIKTPGYRDRVLTEQALVRAHFLEHIAGQGALPDKKDEFFLLGLFSLLDILLGQPMTEVMQQARLPQAIRDAMLGQAGAYFDALQLAIATEGTDYQSIEDQTARCGLDAVEVSRCTLAALTWANEVTAVDDN
ncbi:MAG TPA: HDOD domain-containing protein [Rhodocyclaceae bacterium]|nr:HDOD domain-containing protein [Rhodocyclaceae bacterium]